MSTAFDLLREAREQRRMTLTDVADATLISIDNLRAIEQGRIDILPQPYIRAFMREYAVVVGLDPALLMQKFDRERQAAPPPAAEPPTTGGPEPEPAAPPSPAPAAESEGAPRDTWRYARVAVVIVTLAVGSIILWNILGRETPVTPERPFHEVVRENERRAGGDSLAHPAAAPHDTGARRQAATTDSLTLEAYAADSVWVRLMLDNNAPREYFFNPGVSATWRAREQVLFLTIGNPGAFTLRLNGRPLALPGKRGVPLQRLAVRAAGIVAPDTAGR